MLTVIIWDVVLMFSVNKEFYMNCFTRLTPMLVLVMLGTSLPAQAQQAVTSKPTVCTSTNPAITTASTTILAANGARKVLIIQNRHATGTINIDFNATASSTDYQIAAAGGVFRQDTGASNQAITAIGSVANTDVTVISCQ